MSLQDRNVDLHQGVAREFQTADTVEAALELLSTSGEDMRILAGGTDLVLQRQRGEATSGAVLHIGRIDELDRVTLADGVVRVGALVTHTRLQSEPLVAGTFEALSEAAAQVGGWQTQAVGTIGGNICNASPAADTLPPLLIAEARVELRSKRGTRMVSLDDFVLGRRSIDRQADELVTAVELPVPDPPSGEVYLKVAPRGAMEVAVVGLAMRLTMGADGEVADARVAVGSVGPKPFRARSAEQALVANLPEADAVAAAGDSLVEQASPIDDVRATASYRQRILPALLARAFAICQERAAAA